MASGGTNDFFLQFGSDAPKFAKQLTDELPKGVKQIDLLVAAMEKYDDVAGKLKTSGSPINLNFEGLDQAAGRIETATTNFTRQFGAQINELVSRIAGLAEVLASGARYAPMPASATATDPARTPGRTRQVVAPSRAAEVAARAATAPARTVTSDGAEPRPPLLRQVPPKPTPPPNPDIPKELDGWPAQGQPRADAPRREWAAYEKKVKEVLAKASDPAAVTQAAQDYAQATAKLQADMPQFLEDMKVWNAAVKKINAANDKALAEFRAEHASWSAAQSSATAEPRGAAPNLLSVPEEPVRPTEPVRPSILESAPRQPKADASQRSIERYENQLQSFLEENPGADQAIEEYGLLVEEFTKADALWREASQKFAAEKARIEQANAHIQAEWERQGSAAPSVPSVEPGPQQTSAVSAVTDADIQVARSAQTAAAKSVDATSALAQANSEIATTATSIVDTLAELNAKIKESLGGPATTSTAAETGTNDVGPSEVQVGNTTSNPVPVVVVGGESQAGAGHPPAHPHGPPVPKPATTATATTEAQRKVEAVAAHRIGGSNPEPPPSVPIVGPRRRPEATEAAPQSEAVGSEAGAAMAAAANTARRTTEQWEALSDSYRSRLERGGITRESYVGGAPLSAARGHASRPDVSEAIDQAAATASVNPEAAALGRARRIGGGALPPPPPRIPSAPPAAPEPEEPEGSGRGRSRNLSPIGSGARDLSRDGVRQGQFEQLGEETQRVLAALRAELEHLATMDQKDPMVRAQQDDVVARAGGAYKSDPAINEIFDNASHRANAFADFMGIDTTRRGNVGYLRGGAGRRGVLANGGAADDYVTRPTPQGRPNSSAGGGDDAANAKRLADYKDILANNSDRVAAAMIRQAQAQKEVNQLDAQGTPDADAYAAAQLRLAEATQKVALAQQQDQKQNGEQSGWQQFSGKQTSFGADLRRHASNALENTIGYTLVFSGFEKLKEVVHTGLEAQAAFVRLGAALQANGADVGNLHERLQQISSDTASPLEHTIEAASELAGVFTNIDEIAFGTMISSQLANISQGTLTAKEAAIGLRDVIAAYGGDWQDAGHSATQMMQQTGDQIAHLSQLTGVSVKDITEGTTQIAQEARDFGLNQRQAATLTAYVTRGTGEPGEEAASQTSRLLSSLYNGKVQQQLISTGVASDAQFQTGDIGGVLTNLISKYDKLSASSRQVIASLMGTGIQARAFAALMNGGTQAVNELNNSESDMGALSRQNAAYMATIAGQVKQLSEDFQNFGSVLQQLGAFDAIGLLAKAMDEVLHAFNATFGKIADFMNSNPITSSMLHMTMLVLEGAAAWKLFGGTVTTALARIGVGRIGGVVSGLSPSNSEEMARAAQAGQRVPAPRYDRIPFSQAVQGIASAPRRLISAAWNGRNPGTPEEEPPAPSIRPRPSPGPGLRPSEEEIHGLGVPPLVVPGAAAAAGGAAQSEQALATARAMATLQAEIAVLQERTAQLSAEMTAEGRVTAEGAAELDRLMIATREATSALATMAAEAEAAGAEEETAAAEGGGAAGGGAGGLLKGIGLAIAIGGVMSILDKGKQENAASNSAATDVLNQYLPDNADQSSTDKARASTVKDLQSRPGHSMESALGYAFSAHTFTHPIDTLKEAWNPDTGLSTGDGNKELGITTGGFKKYITAIKPDENDPAKLQKAINDYDAYMLVNGQKLVTEIAKHSKVDAAQAATELQAAQEGMDKSMQTRILKLQGLSDFDVLSSSQTDQLLSLVQTLNTTDKPTLETAKSTIANMLQNAPISQKGRDAKNLNVIADPNASSADVLNSQKALYQNILTNANSVINQPNKYDPNSTEYQTAQSNRATALQGIQAVQQQILQNAVAGAQNMTQLFTDTGNTQGASAQMQAQITALQNVNTTLRTGDPQLIANLTQIQALKLQIAQNAVAPEINKLNLQAAGTSDPVTQAKLNLQAANLAVKAANEAYQAELNGEMQAVAAAQKQLNDYVHLFDGVDVNRLDPVIRDTITKLRSALTTAKGKVNKTGTNPAKQQADLAKQQQDVTEAQAAEQLAESQYAAQTADIRNNIDSIQAQINGVLATEVRYSRGALKSAQKEAELQGQQTQLEIQKRDAIEAQKESVLTTASALDKLQGNDVAAAAKDLQKAQEAYAYAVKEYKKNSQQANDALGQVYQAQGALYAAQLAQQNSSLDLQIAQLNARGQAGDSTKAAQDEVQKAKNAISSYLKAGGKKGTSAYDELQATLATAQRSAFDTALQAQLDTLDFQQQTYQITSAQEVQSLQQILKNKQLTLQEQRDITLKIKGLQDSIRQQLTEGGLNIPSNISLPTAYEVRRSLGAGFTGASTHVSTVNNNQQVVVNNNVPNAQVAQTIANQVITLINQQTNAGLRASSSTPRQVPTK